MLELHQFLWLEVPTSHSWQDTGAHKLSFSLAAVFVERKPRHVGWQGCTVLREDQIVSPGANCGVSPKGFPLPGPLWNLPKTDLGTEGSESSSEQMQCFHDLRGARFFYTEKKKINCRIHFHFCKTMQKVFVNVMLISIRHERSQRHITDLQFSLDLFHICKSLSSMWCRFCVWSWGSSDLCCFCKQGNSIQQISLVINLC